MPQGVPQPVSEDRSLLVVPSKVSSGTASSSAGTAQAAAVPTPIAAPSSVSASGEVKLARAEINAPYEILGNPDESVRNAFPPERIVGGRYIIEERVGEGGMGRIYKVRHRDLGKQFALKIIHKNLAQQPHIRDAFYREARMAASMNHPNIVSVFDFGVDPTHGAFIVMEYLSGETLAERMSREGVLEPKASCDIVLQCAEALAFIHSFGVIHCGLKPRRETREKFSLKRTQPQ